MANDPQRIRCALYPGRALLASDLKTVDGWGVGFYQGGEVLLQRRPKPPPGPVDFYEVVRDIHTDALVGHIRSGTYGGAKNENTHPFRFRSWLFAHHGSIARFDEVREQLLGVIPDFLRRNIRGQTDSEHLFHLLLTLLHNGGKIDDPMISTKVAARALAEALAICERMADTGRGEGGEQSSLNVALTNGRILLATRIGRPLHLYRINGVRDCPVCRENPAEYGRGTHSADHEHLRAVVIVADGADEKRPLPSLWQEVPERSIVSVSHELHTEITPLKSLS
jgi:glutamine amidotransferase